MELKKIAKKLDRWYVRIIALFIVSIIIYLVTNSISISSVTTTIMGFFAFINMIMDIKKEKDNTRIKQIIIEKEKIPNWMINELKERKRKEKELEIIINKLKYSFKTARISVKEIIKHYDRPIKAILIYKFRERHNGKKSKLIPQRLLELGFKYLQSGIYILPPIKTPQYINTGEELKKWIYDNVITPIDGELEYVFPFVAIIDLRKVYSEKKARKKDAWGKTIFNVLNVNDLPPDIVFNHLKNRNITLRDLISLGDIVFLASFSCDDKTLSLLEKHREEIFNEIKRILKKENIELEDIAKLEEKSLYKILKDFIPNAERVANAIIQEAIFWKNFLSS